LKVDEDGLMGSYLQRPGIHPWAGEHVGKYLETASNVWRNTHDVRLKKQMDRMMFELINTQEADGYLGTYTKDKHWTSWDVWSHKYNLYGLLAYYEATGYQPALEACKKMGDLLATTFGNKANQLDIILAGTHMGMAATSVLDPMVELYRYTGDKKYLDFCYYIVEAWEHDNGPKIISRLLSTGKVNKVGNGKSYEMLSNFLGLTNLYRLTGDEALIKPVLIAWQDIIDNRLYITGTTSAWEYFQEEGVLPAEEESHMSEGCLTTTWLQLNQSLFSITGDLKFYEQIEKTIYNHLLAAENPLTGCVSYYTPLMGIKPFTCYITCCQSSVPRGMALLPPFAFGKINQLPTLVLYEEASYKSSILSNDKKSIDLKISVQSKFPENGNLSINVGIIKKANFTLALRVPAWSSSFVAIVGGKEYKGNSNESILIDRTWNNNDRIAISFDMPIHTKEGGKNYAGQIAFMRGPQVLAYDASINRELPIDFLQTATKLRVRKPVVAKEKQLLPTTWIGKQVYNVSAPGTSVVAKHIRLVPYADASQTGGSIKVWLPLTVAEY
ncbi:MAG: hypothetical protein HOP37_00545, partial [Cyclobacteriaceae bacterium]|nr:hypothetical protein [Cyclobacteriaceae bacterium]